MCNDSTLLGILSVLKMFLILIQFIVPILLIVFASLSFIKLVKDPEEKNGIKKIINQFLAAAIIFFIPVIVNILMSILGETTKLSSCWNNASSKIELSSTYKDTIGELRKKFLPDTSKYDKGVPKNLDFTCTSSIVKSQFSCETLKIVEKHLYDFDATNFNSVISSYGGFDAYAKSLGGIFGEYYGKKIEGRTEEDFQKAAEYVLGWMYMYGWDYMNGGGRHVKWNGQDGFYYNGGFVGKFILDSKTKQYSGIGTDFDHIISGKNGGVGRMASECGDLEMFVYNKLGISRDKQLPKVTRLRDLKVGDCVFFGSGAKWNKFDEGTWKTPSGGHNIIVGEVHDNKVVFYDGGSYFQSNRNYKREVYFPKEDSEAADDRAILNEFKYDSWGVRRWYNFEEG